MGLLDISQKEYYKAVLKAKLILEPRLQRALKRLHTSYASELYDSYVAYGVANIGSDFSSELNRLLFRHYNSVGKVFSTFTSSNINKDLVVDLEKIGNQTLLSVQSLFSDRASTSTQQIVSTLQQESRNVEFAYLDVVQNLSTDGSYDRRELAKLLRDLLIARADYKSQMIAITETTWASETTKQAEIPQITTNLEEENSREDIADVADVTDEERSAILLYGYAGAVAAGIIQQKKTWLAVLDSRTRPWHASATGQKVGINDSFLVGGELMPFPGMGSAGNSANCRCVVVYDLD